MHAVFHPLTHLERTAEEHERTLVGALGVCNVSFLTVGFEISVAEVLLGNKLDDALAHGVVCSLRAAISMGIQACCNPRWQLRNKLCAFFDTIISVVLEQREEQRFFVVGQHPGGSLWSKAR